jgi:hypothetical protein
MDFSVSDAVHHLVACFGQFKIPRVCVIVRTVEGLDVF